MTVLVIGDVVGDAGCAYLRRVLPGLKKKYAVDITVANGENASEGNGILPASAKFLFDSGVNVITTGNHGLKRRTSYEAYDKRDGLIRPANYHHDAPGEGCYIYDNCRHRLCVINLQGIIYMQQGAQNPFDCIDDILRVNDTACVLIDFHAEATSEKLCMGHYLDGRVSAVVGTHTHVPTADARILPRGTGYVTDIGMCGGINSVLGVRAEDAVYRMRTGLPAQFANDQSDIRLSGVVLEIDSATGKCTAIESILML
ncbi:MAG: TIGR00282 family metallophosphoesterase [Oscillospiraceae bacterium]|nr:TIGR00282 family metallophosphoesterase [Oscillospiraceae bacterium]